MGKRMVGVKERGGEQEEKVGIAGEGVMLELHRIKEEIRIEGETHKRRVSTPHRVAIRST